MDQNSKIQIKSHKKMTLLRNVTWFMCSMFFYSDFPNYQKLTLYVSKS